MRLLRTPIPQPPTPTLLKVMDFLKSLENSENLPDYGEYSKHHEDYFFVRSCGVIVIKFRVRQLWGVGVEG